MSKINILNLVLFIVVISLAFVIYFSEEPNTQLNLLTSIDTTNVNTIRIHHNNNETLIIKNGNQHWDITQPISIAANDFRINSLLKLLNAPVHSRYSTDEIDLSDTGFSDSSTNISFDDQTINFGTNNAATSLRYVKLNNAVYTIEDVYYPLLSSNFGTLVSLNLIPKGNRIVKLILKNLTLSKNDENIWQSNNEITADNINKILDDWRSAQAFGVHEYLERDELGEVFIYLTDLAEPITYTITDTDPWLILARPELGLEYHLDVDAYNKLIEPH